MKDYYQILGVSENASQKEIKKALDLLDEFSPYDIFVIPVRLDECQPADERLQALVWIPSGMTAGPARKNFPSAPAG